MAGAQFAAVFGVVAEIFSRHCAVLIADQAVTLDHGRVEFNLQLDVFRYGEECTSGLFHEHLSGLGNVVDIVVVSVSVVGDRFHLVVLIISHAIAEYRETDAALCFLFYVTGQVTLGGDADVKVTVGSEDDAVIPALNKVFFSCLIGHFQSVLAVCRAACFQRFQERHDSCLFTAFYTFAQNLFSVRIRDQCHTVVFRQIFHKRHK